MKPYSIVRRLIVVMLVVELLAAVVVAGLAVEHEKHERFQAFDVMLRGRADSLLGAVQQAGDEADTVMLDGTQSRLPKEDLFLVQAQGEPTLGRSANWTEEEAEHARIDDSTRSDVFYRKGGTYFPLTIRGVRYRMMQLDGVRMVDPGEKGGGIARRIKIIYGSPLSHVWHEVNEALRFYALMSVCVMIATALLMVWLLRRGLAPLQELVDDAATVSVHSWAFAPSERVMATRELRPLAVALSDVLDGLKESFLQRDRFVGDAAHELKTGVAVVKSSLQLLTMRERTAADYVTGLKRAEVDCERMEAIVAKMLLLAGAEHHEESGEGAAPAGVSAGDVLRAVAEELAPMAETRGVTLKLHLAGDALVAAEADEIRLISANLIENALQHSASGTVVDIALTRAGDDAEMRIEDHGSGIAEEDLPHVFERFYRGDRSRSRNTGGTGLGLAICKAIVTRLNGSIAIRSKPGAGTNVLVRLPVFDR